MTTKAEIIVGISAILRGQVPVTNTAIDAVLDALGAIVRERLAAGDDVPLPGLGKLKTKKTLARTGRNPRTGDAVDIPAGVRARFVPGKELKTALRGGRASSI